MQKVKVTPSPPCLLPNCVRFLARKLADRDEHSSRKCYAMLKLGLEFRV